LKFLHLIQDEKFPDSAYEFFEAVAPGQSTYMLAGTSEPIKHLKKIQPERVPKYAFWNPNFIRSLEQYDVIILHSLYGFSLEVLARVNSRVPVVWIGMGYDYYDLLISSPSDFLKPETLASHNPKTSRLKKNPKRMLRGVFHRLAYPNARRKRELIKKIDLFAPVLESEYKILKNALGEDSFPKYVRWNYGKIADLVDGKLGHKGITGKNILIGNSASPNNNHLDVFKTLAEAGIPDDSNIIVPLSYGDPIYREKVIAVGYRLFGEQFQPVTKFMELEEYIRLLSSCSSVVMNHLRQQGAGNLFITQYLGAKIYLDKANPLFSEFQVMGLEVRPLELLSHESGLLNQPLDPEKVVKQQEVVKKTRGRAAFEGYTESLIDEISKLSTRESA
jgi:dTDP-N-acetylfucosamine:lipid II N-acetylfucosaminyltransferase